MKNLIKKILVTGSAGFIGAALVKRLLNEGINVIGIDNLNEYYDVNLKLARKKTIEEKAKKSSGNWEFYRCSLEDKKKISDIFYNEKTIFNNAFVFKFHFTV